MRRGRGRGRFIVIMPSGTKLMLGAVQLLLYSVSRHAVLKFCMHTSLVQPKSYVCQISRAVVAQTDRCLVELFRVSLLTLLSCGEKVWSSLSRSSPLSSRVGLAVLRDDYDRMASRWFCKRSMAFWGRRTSPLIRRYRDSSSRRRTPRWSFVRVRTTPLISRQLVISM